MHTDRTESKFRIQSPGENTRSGKEIGVVWPIRITPIPHTAHISARPPATAASPVALALDMPPSTLLGPISARTDGARGQRHTPEKTFFLQLIQLAAALLIFSVPKAWRIRR